MQPRLAAGDLAGPISAALTRVAADLRAPVAGAPSADAPTPALGIPAVDSLDPLATARAGLAARPVVAAWVAGPGGSLRLTGM